MAGNYHIIVVADWHIDCCCRYSSGAEDGYVRVHRFDQSYFDFDFDY